MTDIEKIQKLIQRFAFDDPTVEADARALTMGMLANANKNELEGFVHGFVVVLTLKEIADKLGDTNGPC